MNRFISRIPHCLKRSGKNLKIVYYVKNVCRNLMPKCLLRSKLFDVLAETEIREDKEYIYQRVNYYNQLRDNTPLPPKAKTLGQHRLRGNKSVYFFDTYEYTRYFPTHLKWLHLFGDIVHVPDLPSIVKSRPLVENNVNSVLLNLDKVRHFCFLSDKKTFASKMDKVIFRGAVHGKPQRQLFMNMYFGNPCCDLGDVATDSTNPKEWQPGVITLYEHLDYKFIMALEGNDVASNLKWVMSSNSLAVMPKPTCETWFMEGKLIPNYHYVEIKSDFSDLIERMNYYIEHTDEAQEIIDHAHEFVQQFLDKRREKLISLLVLHKYFKQTSQISHKK